MLHEVPELARTLLAFAVVLGVLVAVHEYGHYLAARLCGFHVEAFSIGFGRAIAGWTDRHGTRWQVGWLPLGGFVRLHGQQRPEDMTEEERAALRPGEGFHDRSLGARAIVTVAGPVANFLLALVVFTGLFLAIGQPTPSATIGAVSPGGAAARAGLMVGDRVLSIDGKATPHFEDIQRIVVAYPGAALQLRIARAGAELTVPVVPDAQVQGGARIGLLGVRSGGAEYRPVGPVAAVVAGARQTWSVGVQTAEALWQIITGQRGTGELGGFVKIAEVSGQAAGLGPGPFVELIALLSVNLGLLNLMPIPVLDGGHLVLYGLEAVRGRPLPARVQEYGFRVGLGLILTIMVLVNGRDLLATAPVRWVVERIG